MSTNTKLRTLRETTPSRVFSGMAMSRSELAELVAEHVWKHHGIETPFDRKYLAKLEQGRIRWPNARYREALRALLHVERDADLGFVDFHRVRASKALDGRVADEPAAT